MFASFTLICGLALGSGPVVESAFNQIAPVAAEALWVRTPGRAQAVILVHGFHYHALSVNVPKAEFRSWQKRDAVLVKELAPTADVYAFAYGQNVPLDTIVKESKLGESIVRLRKMGYADITLVGHSAGGLIARHFVEDYPDAGVTKVVQICAPNGGSPLATLVVHRNQKPFVECLTEKHRENCQKERSAKVIPATVQFVCVIAKGDGVKGTDGVVPCRCQWTDDLQKQGIPAFALPGGHREIVRDAKSAEALARLLREPFPRWPAQRIDQAKAELFPAPPRPAPSLLPRPAILKKP